MSSARIRKIFPLDPQSPPNQKTPWYPLCPNDTTTACHANYLTSDGLRECPTILRLEGDQASRCHTLQQCCLHHQKLVCAYMAIAANVYFCSPTAESLPYACASAFVCQRLDHQWLHSPWAGLPMVGFPGAPAIRHPPDTTMHSECLVLFDVRVVLVLHIFLLEVRLRFIELPPTAGLLMSL